MEGVGARLGRSSNRYGTTTIFTGPVRKWKKDWIPITPSSSPSSNNSNHHHHHHHINGGSLNGNNGSISHLRLFKWTPVSVSSNRDISNSSSKINSNISNGDSNKDDAVSEEPVRKKFKFVPIAVLEEQKKQAEENSDDEAKPADIYKNTAAQASNSDGHEETPDINDVPMEEDQGNEENQGRQDLNESLDLSLGLTSHEEGRDSMENADGALR